MQTGEWIRAFASLIKDQIAATRALAGRLEAEADALLQRDLGRLDAVTADKQRCIESLERIESERRALVSALAGRPEPADFLGLLRRTDDSGRLAAEWQELVTLLESCRARNVQNGRLVALRRAHLLRSLAILQGSPAAITYGPAGLASTGPRQRDLARV
jgi:flagellar biosynthesis/type III secretory pathway chaperone